MNYQVKAFQRSFLLHGVIIALVFIGSTIMGQYKKTMDLDFDLRKPVPAVIKVEERMPAPVMKSQSINPAARQSLQKKEPPRLQEETPRMSSVPEAPPVVKLPDARSLESSPMGLVPDQEKAIKEGPPGYAGAFGTDSGTGDGNGAEESAGAKYLNENFAYIRDKILRNVSYPDTARRKDWQGKVLLSFIITADGTVRAFKIIQSSGYAILDRSALETVRDAAPFPRPPGEAQLVIPIIYHLE